VEDLPVTARHRRIAAAISNLYPGGFEVWGCDLMVCKNGQEYCLEINDSSIGFNENHEKEDIKGVVECVLRKLIASYSN
jgi:glutathione synthase/RimK-type ligase-like ATP-grasp enzyme